MPTLRLGRCDTGNREGADVKMKGLMPGTEG